MILLESLSTISLYIIVGTQKGVIQLMDDINHSQSESILLERARAADKPALMN